MRGCGFATAGLAMVAVVICGCAGPARRATLYEDLGGPDGLVRIVDESTALWLADDRIGRTWSESNIDRFKSRLVAQLCQLSGGGCDYRGRGMAAAHKGLHLDTLQFNALAEDMEIAMDKLDVPFATQNRLMALLAPMRRDVVTR